MEKKGIPRKMNRDQRTSKKNYFKKKKLVHLRWYLYENKYRTNYYGSQKNENKHLRKLKTRFGANQV